MTPRERVLAAVSQREHDRAPIDQGSLRSSGIVFLIGFHEHFSIFESDNSRREMTPIVVGVLTATKEPVTIAGRGLEPDQ